MNVVIVDYGEGNINSIKRAFSLLGVDTVCSHDNSVINSADALVMPGVGHFKAAMNFLKSSKLDIALNHAVNIKKIPVLGICLGMQLMTNYSEEGEVRGLGWINALTKKIVPRNKEVFKVPHIGWNLINGRSASVLLDGIDCTRSPFYFCHSYAIRKIDENSICTSLFNYEDKYVSIFESGNIYGVQFHPEKSHAAGTAILSNFLSNINK